MKKIDSLMCRRQLHKFEQSVQKYIENDTAAQDGDNPSEARADKEEEPAESDEESTSLAHDVALRKRLRKSSTAIDAIFSDSD